MDLFKEITSEIGAHVDIRHFYSQYFSDFSFGKNILCPFHKDTTPSFRVNEDGSFKCFSANCQTGGGGPTKFYSLKTGIPYDKAQIEMYSKYVTEVIDDRMIERWQKKLTSEIEERLLNERGITKKTIVLMRLGWSDADNEQWLVVPQENHLGLVTCIYYVNAFRNQAQPKVKPQRKGYPTGRIWPIGVCKESDQIMLCEGFTDTLCALSYDVPAVTIGGASGKIKTPDLQYFHGKEVVILYDTDDAGRKGATEIANQLCLSSDQTNVKIVSLPVQAMHKDLSDYLHIEKHRRDDLFNLVNSTPFYKPAMPNAIKSKQLIGGQSNKEISFVPFEDIRNQDWHNRLYQTEAMIAGRAPNTISCPRRIQVRCFFPKRTCRCPIISASGGIYNFELDKEDPEILHFMEEKHEKMISATRRILQLGRGCQIDINVVKVYTVTKILVSSPVRHAVSRASPIESIQILAYYFGTNIASNLTYILKGFSSISPRMGRRWRCFWKRRRWPGQ